MKNYLEACGLLLTEIMGRSNSETHSRPPARHQRVLSGGDRNCAYVERFSRVENIAAVVGRAVSGYGATVMIAIPASEGEVDEDVSATLRIFSWLRS